MFIRNLARQLKLTDKVKLGPWLKERDYLTPVQRLGEFIEDVVLAEISQEVVIFVDEIDKILSLPFPTDDFFAYIRACYNLRADKPEYERLTFALLGVANPSDLVRDKTVTPFNIGRGIQLTGFRLEEAEPLERALGQKAEDARAVLEAVLDWTGGQPFLTQKVCRLVALLPEKIARGEEVTQIEQLVTDCIIDNWEARDEPVHLKTIRDRLLRNERRAGRLLGMYQRILEGGRIAADDSYDQVELRLSGLVVEDGGWLRSYNRVYSTVFDREWVERELAKLRPYSEAITAWLASDGKDESRLLQGQALEDALVWSVGKSLGERDFRFLSASQEIALKTEKEAKQILADAQRKAKWFIQIGSAFLIASLVGAAIAGVFALVAVKERNIARQATDLERDARKVIDNQPPDTTAVGGRAKAILLLPAMQLGQRLQNLLLQEGTIVRLGQRLQRLLNQDGSSEKYPAFNPVFALQQAVFQSHHEQTVFTGHQSGVLSVSFSPDGQSLATASSDGTARLWSLDGELVQEFTGHQDWVRSVSFSPDGQSLATASDDGTARLWAVKDLAGLLAVGCSQLDRYWSTYPVKLFSLEVCHNPSGLRTAAIVLANTGKWEEAVSSFEKALELDSEIDLNPDTEEVIEQNPVAVAQKLAAPVKVEEGLDLVRQGDVEGAIAAFKEAQTFDPELEITAQS